jgi:hypothetical protein
MLTDFDAVKIENIDDIVKDVKTFNMNGVISAMESY